MSTSAGIAATVIARCRELARISDAPGQTTRTFLSPATRDAHALVSKWMRAAGMRVGTDAIGNLRGVLVGATADAPRLLIGSHLDTVIHAGAFDGPLGVVLGISLAEAMAKEHLTFSLEVIGFSEEEGVRFVKPFLGSLAVIGELDDPLLELKDENDVTVRRAVQDFGLDPGKFADAVAESGAFGYLEFHIEQGPVLENEAVSLGIVDAIAGQTRMQMTFRGRANHAGTTPMGKLRRDAVSAAAEWICEVERYANGCLGLVATTGKVQVPGGAANVIAGTCVVTLDVRHGDDARREEAVKWLTSAAKQAGSARGVEVEYKTTLDQSAVAMDVVLTDAIAEACKRATRTQPRRMISGAGHDAMILARRLPAAMVFLRTPEGLSHHPDESVSEADVQAAFETGLEFLQRLRDDREMLDGLVAHAQEYGREVRGA